MAPLEIRHRSVRPISAKHAQASRFLQQSPLPRGWPLTAYRRTRLELMLRALDLRLGGATYRDIAIALGKDEAAHLSATEWKTSGVRSCVYRLVRDAHTMMNGDYRKLLRIR
ncbi:DUF2285 domain-containing protein [Sphingomonas sp. C8-2]|nr:DUF2285 domain-containing protein [Sphingomonas sp. C8-2]